MDCSPVASGHMCGAHQAPETSIEGDSMHLQCINRKRNSCLVLHSLGNHVNTYLDL